MEPHRERLPSWALSFMDDAKGDGSFDACSFYTLALYGDRAAVAAIADEWHSRTDDRGPYRYRQPYIDRLEEAAWALWPMVPDDIRYSIVITAILDMQLHIRDHAEWLADCAMQDACEGGNLKPWRKPPRAGLYGAWYPGRKAQRRLNSPRFIRDYARRNLTQDYVALREKIRRYARTTRSLAVNWQEADMRIGEILEAQEPSTIPDPPWRRELALFIAGERGIKIRPLRSRERKRARRPLIKAANFAADLIGPRLVGAFIRGEPVDLRGSELTFRVKRAARNLKQSGHGCLAIGVHATGGPALGTLCWYVENTPTLDQLAAIALHVESGTEREILAISNMTTITSDGINHPLVMDRMAAVVDLIANGMERQRLPEMLPQFGRNPAFPRTPMGRNRIDYTVLRRERKAQYWAATNAKWIEAVAVVVAGPRAPKLLSQPLMEVA